MLMDKQFDCISVPDTGNNPISETALKKRIRIEIDDVSTPEFQKNGKIVEAEIANIPWHVITTIFNESLAVRLNCQSEKPDKLCIVSTILCFVKKCHSSDRIYSSRETEYTSKFSNDHLIELKELSEYGYIQDNTIIFEMDITILEYHQNGNPELVLKQNPDYQCITGEITHTFTNISKLKGSEEQYSKSISIGGFVWRLAFSQCGNEVQCNWSDISNWSCSAKVEQRVLNESKSDVLRSATTAKELSKHANGIREIKLNWFNIIKKNALQSGYDSLTIQSIITVFKLIEK